MRKKKELTETEKRDLAMKYEVAEELGLLEIDGGRVRLTRRGMEVSNVALAEFLL